MERTSLIDRMRHASDVFNAYKVRPIRKWEIKNRGPVWDINTAESKFPTTLGGLRSILGWLVREEGSEDVYEIKGVELPAVMNREDMEIENVSLLLKSRQ
jgi:hypothetical protein